MVRKPNFKLLAKGDDITEKIKANLISLNYEDKEGSQSDEMSFVVNGIYAKPAFGDDLELYLGYESLYLCGKFAVQTATRDYKANTTEVRATAVNFASPQKVAKRQTWQDTTLFNIASKIANQNSLNVKTSGADQPIASVLQNDISDVDFLYQLSVEYGYLMKIANKTIIITAKDGKSVENSGAGLTPKNENLPLFKVELNECESLNITEANRNSYTAVIVQWHDSKDGKDKQVKVGNAEGAGSGNSRSQGGFYSPKKSEIAYKLNIPEPKSDNEAFKKGEAKLNELQRGGINGSLSTAGREIRAGGKLK